METQCVLSKIENSSNKSSFLRNKFLTWKFIYKGVGLYAARDLEKYTMIIEFVGNLIRNEVANRYENLYQQQVLGSC